MQKADLVDYSKNKGSMIIRPYGYAIWENMVSILDKEFKRLGHENVQMPMLIPESLLNIEKEHVEGFAPEVAWVTYGGENKLEERMCIRPTSETLFCDHFKKIVNSYRDLPILYNQWCTIVRWEKQRDHSCVVEKFCGKKDIHFMQQPKKLKTKLYKC